MTGSGATPAARVRQAYLDNLKVVLVTGVILGHAFITYGDIGSWAYRETSTNDARARTGMHRNRSDSASICGPHISPLHNWPRTIHRGARLRRSPWPSHWRS